MTFDRFKEPTRQDDYCNCRCCDERFHYEDLNDDGYCPSCQEALDNQTTEQPNDTV